MLEVANEHAEEGGGGPAGKDGRDAEGGGCGKRMESAR